jgi:predicted ferric reductase
MRRTDLSGDGFLKHAPWTYWQYSLWLIAGLTLVALLLSNTLYWPVKAVELVVTVVFSLLSSAAMALTMRKMLDTGRRSILGAFSAYAALRFLAAIAVIVGYMLITGARRQQLLPFVILFSVFFVILDALDAVYMVKVQRVLERKP